MRNTPGRNLTLAEQHERYTARYSRRALFRAGDRPAVWVVDRKTGGLTLTPVDVREYRHETVVLSGGVKPGQWVVTAGVQKLDAGLTVRPWEENR